MSDRVALVRAAFDAWNDRDAETLAELATPDVVMDTSRNVFNPDVHRGIEGAKRSWAATGEIWETVRLELVEVLEVDERIVTRQLLAGVGAGSGVPAEMELYSVIEFRDDRIARVIGGFRDRATALEVASADELPDPQPR